MSLIASCWSVRRWARLFDQTIYRPCYDNSEWCEPLVGEDYEEVYNHGVEIHRLSVLHGRHDKRDFIRYVNGVMVDGNRVHGLSEVSACAIARHFSLPFIDSYNSFKKADLDYNIEVRLIGVDRYGLRVNPDDVYSRRVVGCVIEPGKEHEPYRIPGWINAKFGKKPLWLIDPLDRKKPVFAVPQYKLRSLDLLRDEIQKDIQKKNAYAKSS